MIQYYISVLLFAVFVALVAGRAVILRRNGINAIVFGVTDKSDFLLVPFVLAIIYTVCSSAFGLPMWKPLITPFWETQIPGMIGIAFCVIAVVGMGASLVSFGNSFRVGIDEQKPDKLVTAGAFAFTRNPVYVCFDTFFCGQFLIHRNIIIAVAVVGFALAIHRQVLREERFLIAHYGREYEAYRKKVRRYL
ncbi:MAG: isoprenylcysteine carboxylmethyltransferase family protein [Peptococcaceae bacterium]|jgi:protein-S-isoprenylcysteine O-methyltransferase Ste14|nr:isoprenylcysteine carboxylmethyltransferase family protein [Peptococcaceae bacterium]